MLNIIDEMAKLEAAYNGADAGEKKAHAEKLSIRAKMRQLLTLSGKVSKVLEKQSAFAQDNHE